MLHLTDTHSHIYLPEFKDDLSDVIDRALQAGVERILLPNIDSTTMDDLLALVRRYPDMCFPMTGLHPTSVNESFRDELSLVEKSLQGDTHFVAVGEIGMDLYWDKTFVEEQKIAFDAQIQLAIRYGLPVVVHCRDAFDEIFEVMSHYRNDERFSGVIHSFTGTEEQMSEILSYPGFYIGINGIVTFKKSHLPELLQKCPVDRVLIETDCPYLTPVPYRGKRNESSYVYYVCKKLAEIYGMSMDDMSAVLSNNTNRLFNF